MFKQFPVSRVQFKVLNSSETHWDYEEALMFVPTVWWMYELCWWTKDFFFVHHSKTSASYQAESDAGVECVCVSHKYANHMYVGHMTVVCFH